MNPEIQIMFHVLLYTICVLIGSIYDLNEDMISGRKKEINQLGKAPQLGHFHLVGLFMFVPVEIVFWSLYWVFVS